MFLYHYCITTENTEVFSGIIDTPYFISSTQDYNTEIFTLKEKHDIKCNFNVTSFSYLGDS